MRQNIFQFWLDKGVDALFINDIHVLYESDDTALDEPIADDEAPPVCVFTNYLYLGTLSYLNLCHWHWTLDSKHKGSYAPLSGVDLWMKKG